MGEENSAAVLERTLEEFDTTPKIYYNEGIAVKVESFCVVNKSSLAISTYGLSKKGFTESHFDEHHGIADPSDRVVPRSRLEELDEANPHTMSYLTVLGSGKVAVETHLTERGIKAKHVGSF